MAYENLLVQAARLAVSGNPSLSLNHVGPEQFEFLWSLCARNGLQLSLLRLHDADLCPHVQLPAGIDAQERALKARYMLHTSQLTRIVRCLEERSVVAVPYKGPAVVRQTYGDPSVRSFADIDFLVPKSQLQIARKVIESLGYELLLPRMNPKQYRKFLKNDSEMNYRHSELGIGIEVHWCVLPRRHRVRMDLDSLIRPLRRLTVLGCVMYALSYEDQFFVFCIHAGAKEGWGKLKWITDVAAHVGLHGDEMAWEKILQKAIHLGVVRMILVSLILAERLCELSIPASVRILMRQDRSAQRLAEDAWERLYIGRDVTRLEKFLCHIRSRERFVDRLACCLSTAIGPTRKSMFSRSDRPDIPDEPSVQGQAEWRPITWVKDLKQIPSALRGVFWATR